MPASTFIGHFLGPDTHANRPAASAVPNGALYVCTTHNVIERVVSGAWADWATLGSGGGAGAWTLLSTTSLASPGTFDVSSISGAYNDLLLVMLARGTTASSFSENTNIRLNNDSGANYYAQYGQFAGTSTNLVQSQGLGGSSAHVGQATGPSSPANSFAAFEIALFGYAGTSKLKMGMFRNFVYADPGTGSSQVREGGFAWTSTAAINRVTLFGATTANFATGSELRIYGRL